MGAHIDANGDFQSDKYPTCPPGKVPLSVKDPAAQDLLWEYAQRRRAVDAEFSDDLEACLRAMGFHPLRPAHQVGHRLIYLLRSLLNRVEWNGFDPLGADHACPVCAAVESNGHREGCALAAALTEHV